jgi:hypothetical protein
MNLRANTTVTDLKLVGLKIDVTGWKALGLGLAKNSSVQFLTVNFCKLDDVGLHVLERGFVGTL